MNFQFAEKLLGRYLHFTGFALAFAVLVAKEVGAIHAQDLFPGLDFSQNFDASSVPACGHEFAIWQAIVIDVGRRSEPQLGAIFAARIHHGEVVLARDQQVPLLLFGHFSDAANQIVDFVPSRPFSRGHDFGPDLTFHGVSVAGLDDESGVVVKNRQIAENLQYIAQ